MRARDIVIVAVLASLLVGVQVVLGFLPNIELVSLLIIIYTLVFRQRVIFIIAVFVLIEGLIYGFGLWWLNYMYIWAILALITYFCRAVKSTFAWAIISGMFGLGFGALCALPYFFMGGAQMAFTYWISGIPFDVLHCFGNFAVCLVLFRPLRAVLEKLNTEGLGRKSAK